MFSTALLRSVFTHAGPFLGTTVDLRSPREIGTPAAGANIVSLWLFRVQRYGELDNALPTLRPDGRMMPAPLSLTLHYLVTPLSADEVTTQRLLGHAMQAFDANARLGPEFTNEGLQGSDDAPLRIHIEKQGFENSLRIWQAMNEPYRLSVPYLVEYASIASTRSFERAPAVTDRQTEYSQIVDAG